MDTPVKRRKLNDADDAVVATTVLPTLIADIWIYLFAEWLPVRIILRMAALLSRATVDFFFDVATRCNYPLSHGSGLEYRTSGRVLDLVHHWQGHLKVLALESTEFLEKHWCPSGAHRLEHLSLRATSMAAVARPASILYERLPHYHQLLRVEILIREMLPQELHYFLERLFVAAPRLEVLTLDDATLWMQAAVLPTPLVLPPASGPRFHVRALHRGLANAETLTAVPAASRPYGLCCPQVVVWGCLLTGTWEQDPVLWSQRSPQFYYQVLRQFIHSVAGYQDHPLFPAVMRACTPASPEAWSALEWNTLIWEYGSNTLPALIGASDTLLQGIARRMRADGGMSVVSHLWTRRHEDTSMGMVAQRLFTHLTDVRNVFLSMDGAFSRHFWARYCRKAVALEYPDHEIPHVRGTSREGNHLLVTALRDASHLTPANVLPTAHMRQCVQALLRIWPDAGERVFTVRCYNHPERGAFQASLLQLGLLMDWSGKARKKRHESWVAYLLQQNLCDWMITQTEEDNTRYEKTPISEYLKKKARSLSVRPTIVATALQALQTQKHACIPKLKNKRVVIKGECIYY